LKFNAYDIPFALIYFCSAEFNNFASCATLNTPSGDHKTSLHSGNPAGSASLTNKSDPTVWVYKLQDTIGIPLGHDLAPDTVELHLMEESTEELHVWPFRAMAENQSLIEIKDLPSEVLEGIQHSGWPELPKDAIALPIVGARDLRGREALMGMVVLGINPRRAFDEGYRTFTSMCARQIAASMTLVKNIEEESAKADEMAALNRDRTSFFNSVSHELRTPLTLILGPLDECTEDTSLSQQHKGRLEIVRRNARRLLRLVNSLLDFSRLEAGRMRATFRETNIQRYTADLASLFRSAIEKGGVQYKVDTNGRQRHVWIDRDMWEVSHTVNTYSS
jgi:signal transduction histidine kinase